MFEMIACQSAISNCGIAALKTDRFYNIVYFIDVTYPTLNKLSTKTTHVNYVVGNNGTYDSVLNICELWSQYLMSPV